MAQNSCLPRTTIYILYMLAGSLPRALDANRSSGRHSGLANLARSGDLRSGSRPSACEDEFKQRCTDMHQANVASPDDASHVGSGEGQLQASLRASKASHAPPFRGFGFSWLG